MDINDVLLGIPETFRLPLLEEYRKVVRNYREHRWEPAELGGGKFSEIVYSILHGFASGSYATAPFKPRNMVDACRALEQTPNVPRSVRIQIPRVLLALYEVRNNRNVGHVGGDVDPSYMDATMVLAGVKWVMAELVRLFHAVSVDVATGLVEELTDRTTTLVWNVGNISRVLDFTLSAREKVLVLLYSKSGFQSSRWLAKSMDYKNVSQLRAKVLLVLHREGFIHFDSKSDQSTLSPLGIRFVEQNINLTL